MTTAASTKDTSHVRALSAVAMRGFANAREAAQAIFTLVHELTNMRICVLTRIDLESDRLTVLEAFDKAGLGVASGMSLPASQMPCECVVRSATALREFDLDAHPAFRVLPARTKLGLRSYIGVPLHRSDGRIWGTLAATDTNVCETTDAHIQTLTVLARLAMIEFEREEQRQLLTAHAEMLAERLEMVRVVEEERLRAVRLQTAVEAAVTVSHEINNPLTVLQLRLARIQRRCTDAEPAMIDDVTVALEAAEEIKCVTMQLRKIAQPVTTRYLGLTRMLDLAASSR